ncbi:serine hydrolase domain-containing protein [Govanella unica]|uniref:Beta-lactamase family protein n=1 Tax=Govanella unica TaxID=2975056 RepID=A0A9X3Z7P7_9PROT|nr:serine hydrolase domain-containing protein [Govania unica]MDA5194402.1 beta-lactamase family protein [Govania unica]
MTTEAPILIHGTCDPAFAGLRETLRDNFATRGEVGAAVAVYHHGRLVADLWGGIADPQSATPWDRDSIVCMMSVGKGMAALCLYRLIDRGAVDLDAPVACYWPDFAQNGKDGITIRMLLGGKAGLVYADAAPAGSAFNWDVMCQALAVQKPEWEPGTQGAYHSMTAGILFGEIIRRVDGRTVDVFFQEEIAGPLGVDFQFGLDDTDIERVATIIPNPQSVTLNAINDSTSKLGRAWRIMPSKADFFNTDSFRRGVFPSANGHGNARAVARVFAALGNGGSLDGYHLLSPALIDILRSLSWEGDCGLLDRRFRYGHGFFLSNELAPFGSNPRAFGHPGVGGAIGFSDPEAGLAFSYSPNFMCSGGGAGDRCEALIAATFACIAPV